VIWREFCESACAGHGSLLISKASSWHITYSLAFLPAWVIVALIWHYRIFTATSVGLVLAVHVLLGLSLASYGLAVGAPFGKSPQLAAVASTFGAIVSAILALVFSRASTGAAVLFSLIFPPSFYVFAIRAICGWENHQIPTNALHGDPDNQLRLLPLLIIALVSTIHCCGMHALILTRSTSSSGRTSAL
jgi:ATP-binding cassette subfamily A (ABC1) protein 3